MDALRKAEQQKQQAASGLPAPGAGPAELALQPMETQSDDTDASAAPGATPAGKPGASRLPELPTRLEELDEQFMAHAAEAKTAARPAAARGAPSATTATVRPAAPSPTSATAPVLDADTEASRAAARKLFAAKQPQGHGNRSFAIVVGLVTLAAAAGIGVYFWWQLQPKSSFNTPGTAPKTVPPVAAPQAAAPPPPAPPVATVAPAPTFPPAAATPPQAAAPVREDDGDGDTAPPRRTEKSAPAAAPRPAAARPADPIRISAAPQKANPLFEQAYQAFNNGDIDLAQAAWQKILRADPKNGDALHGLAAVAQRRGQPDRAADYFLRAIEADPKDALAISGLIALRGQADAQQTESRLKNLLAEQPDSPHLNFVLGNLLARDGRWADAQQAYFKAHVADPGNPDYLFNLAVSLDQLRQARLAAQYYNQAIGAAAQRPAGFDPAQAAARLKALQP
jgi:Tfp pilus assembly protein PilF